MIRESPDELLEVIRSHAPDLKKPLAVVREDYSTFYSDMQDEIVGAGAHSVEKAAIRDDLDGYWVSVAESSQDYAILFFHGGGFTRGSTSDHLGLCIRLARAARSQVFSVDYRLAPEHVFPSPIEDAIAAYRYLQSMGYLPHRILPVGISAGGNLVLSSLLSLHGQGYTLPPAAVCMSPATDLQFAGESVTKNQHRDWLTPALLQAIRTTYLAGHDPSDPLASPVHGILKHLPRLYIQVGTNEVLLSDIGTFVEKTRWAGVMVQVEIWEGMFHSWQIFAGQLPEGQEAVDHIGAFIRNVQGR
ncbi:MAG: alpha/beta hydrolase [Methanoregula sp.]|nr:alpha/beta hydrolase [Methanoregula sp.]